MGPPSILSHRDDRPSHTIGSYTSTERLHRVAFSPHDPSLVAVGSITKVEVLEAYPKIIRRKDGEQREEVAAAAVASWRLGAAITTLTWGAKGDEGHLEVIAVAGTAVYQLSVEFVVADSGTRTTTTAKKEVGTGNVEAIHDIAFCPMAGGANFLAAVVNSGCLIWDLSKDDSEDPVLIPHPYPPRVIAFSQAKGRLATVDDLGTPRVIDLTKTPFAVAFLLDEPLAMSSGIRRSHVSIGFNSDGDGVGTLINGIWTIWDTQRNTKPVSWGEAFDISKSAHGVCRWNPINPQIFAVLSTHPKASPPIKVITSSFPEVPRALEVTVLDVPVNDLCWHPTEESIMAAVAGRELYFLRAL